MICEFCENTPGDGLRYKIKDYKFWSVYLWEHPYHLGRCFIRLRRHAEDFFDINEDEKKELFEIAQNLRDAIKNSFGAEMMNYASLGNIVQHVHLHVIPRYSKEINFEGATFKDERWGQNYTPYDKKFDVSEEVKAKIMEKIKLKLA